MSTTPFATDNISQFKAIMNSKLRIDESHADQTIQLIVTNAKYGYFNEKISANVDIYNTNAMKMTVYNSPWFKAKVDEAIALETAGDYDAAKAAFNEASNAATLSFSIINRNGKAVQFVKNQRIQAPIELRDTPDDDVAEGVRTSIVIEKPYALKATIITKTNTDLFSDLVPMTEPTKAIKA